MRYPGAPSTIAAVDHADFIEVDLAGGGASAKHSKAAGAAARAASAAVSATASGDADVVLDTGEWQRLVGQIGNLQPAKLSRKPSSAAIRDKQAAAGNRGLGARVLP